MTTSTGKSALVVVVVEDHEDTRELYLLGLETAGYLAHGAASCAEAVTLFARLQADVVVVDYGLPDGSGADVARACGADVKVRILLTGFDPGDVDTAGFHAVLVKPVDSADLVATIAERLHAS